MKSYFIRIMIVQCIRNNTASFFWTWSWKATNT